jgi:hypothetical protein
MRDLHHRKEMLAYWINRTNADLQGPNENDVLKLIQYIQDKESSILWVIRCITTLLLRTRQLGKRFKDTNKQDIRPLLKWMNDNNYKASTPEKFRRLLKFYYKVIYGNNEHYPEEDALPKRIGSPYEKINSGVLHVNQELAKGYNAQTIHRLATEIEDQLEQEEMLQTGSPTGSPHITTKQ